MRRRLHSSVVSAVAAVLAATVAVMTALPAQGAIAAASPAVASGTFANIPVTGACQDPVTAAGGVFTGVLSITRFSSEGNGPVALATLTGTCGAGGAVTDQQVSVPVAIEQATCEVLRLVLGPLHLELLGLVIDLDRVVLTITADPSGGLLGQFLCALAGGGPLQQIVDLLNRVLDLLG